MLQNTMIVEEDKPSYHSLKLIHQLHLDFKGVKQLLEHILNSIQPPGGAFKKGAILGLLMRRW